MLPKKFPITFAIMIFLMPFSASFSAIAQAHVHGQGQLLIAQDGNKWQFEFLLPAADLLGFEHSPETDAQEQKVESVVAKISQIENVISIPSQCNLASNSHNISLLQSKNTAHLLGHDDKHKHSHDHSDKHSHEHKHDHKKENESAYEHADLTLQYVINCSSALPSVDITLLSWLTSIEALNAQWITNNQQGATTLSSAASVLKF